MAHGARAPIAKLGGPVPAVVRPEQIVQHAQRTLPVASVARQPPVQIALAAVPGRERALAEEQGRNTAHLHRLAALQDVAKRDEGLRKEIESLGPRTLEAARERGQQCVAERRREARAQGARDM